MNRKFTWFVTPLFLACLHLAEAQQPKKLYRVGVLQRSTLPPSFLEAFKRGIREHGYMEGQDIVILKVGTDGRSDSAAELARQEVDVIVATGTGAVLDAKKATRTIPIIMSPAADAVAGGIVASLARPGGNITGLTMITPDLTGKRVELFKEAVPSITRMVAVHPLDTRSTAVPLWLKDTEAAVKQLGFKFQALGLETEAKNWDRAFSSLANDRGSALVVMRTPALSRRDFVLRS